MNRAINMVSILRVASLSMPEAVFRVGRTTVIGLLSILVLSGAQSSTKPGAQKELEVRQSRHVTKKRVEGRFKVKTIKRLDSYYRLVFENIDRTAKTKHLTLDTNYVHIGVERGKVLRLSAEVRASDNDGNEIKQVLLYLPKEGSHSPVWMLSRSHPQMKFTGARLLDMHAPQSDYLLF